FNKPVFKVHAGQVVVVLVFLNAYTALSGYIFGGNEFYGFPVEFTAIGIAIHTALGFAMLSAALLCSRPREGFMAFITSDTRSGRMARRILLTFLLAPLVLGAVTHTGVMAGWYDVSIQAAFFTVIL